MNDVKINYFSVITPSQANLPDDVLRAIPLQSIQNSPVGNPPEDFWEQLAGEIGQVFNTVVGIIYNGLVALANLIEKAADVVNEFAMKLWSTTVSAVKQAVEVVKNAVDALKNAIISIVREVVSKIITPIFNKVKQTLYQMGKDMYELAQKGTDALDTYFITHILPVVLAVGMGIYAMSVVIGKLIEGMPLAGAIVLGAITGGLTAAILTTIMTSKYYQKGKGMDTSTSGIERWLHSVDPGLSDAYSSVVDFWSSIFLYCILEDETGQKTLKSLGIYFISIFASIFFLVAQPPTEETGTAMIPFLALASASGGHTLAMIVEALGKSIISKDIGTMIALTAIGIALGVSVFATVVGDIGYMAEAFT